MDFKSRLATKLREKGLAESSVQLYTRALEKLNGERPFTDLQFLTKVPTVMASVAHLKPNTQRSIFIAILSALSLFKDTAGVEALHKRYYDAMVKIREEMRPIDEGHQKSEKQEANWLPWEEVQSKFEALRKQVEHIAKMDVLDAAAQNVLLDAVVLGLYATLPPRRNKDYLDMMVVSSYDPSTMGRSNILDAKNKMFYFNNYKTQSQYGTQQLPIPPALWRVIEVYFNKRGKDWRKKRVVRKKTSGEAVATSNTDPFPFLESFNGSQFSINSITRILNRVFGRQISSSMLRHMYLSSKYGDVLKEQEADAEAMGHSVEQQKAYIKQ